MNVAASVIILKSSIAFFAALADLWVESGKQVVLTGTKDELEIINLVQSEMKYQAIIAAGRTSLGAMAVLIRDAFALISNCTGPSHISAALETPSIIISMDGEPERWAPLNTGLHYTILFNKPPWDDSFLISPGFSKTLFENSAFESSR